MKSIAAALAVIFSLICVALPLATARAQTATYSFTGTVYTYSFNGSTIIPGGTPVSGTFSINTSVATYSYIVAGYSVFNQYPPYTNGPMFSMAVSGPGFSYKSAIPAAGSNSQANIDEYPYNPQGASSGDLEIAENVNGTGSSGSSLSLYGTPTCTVFFPSGLPNPVCPGNGGAGTFGPQGNAILSVGFTVDSIAPCTNGSCTTPSPVIASTLPNGTAGVAYPSTVLVSNGTSPYTITATGLPPGLTVSNAGVISGTPTITDSGTYQVTVSVTDSTDEMAGPQVVQITIAAAPCSVTSETLASVPGQPSSRQTLGIGEWVKLTTKIAVTWSIISGGGTLSELVTDNDGVQSCSDATTPVPFQGIQACLTAPSSNDTTVVTAKPLSGGPACTNSFITLQPTGLIFRRLQSPIDSPDYFLHIHYLDFRMAMISVAFLTPGNVSFANIRISEHDIQPYHFDPNYNLLLTPVSGTNAWLVGCDFDNDNSAKKQKASYWVFVDRQRTVETKFSLVQTTLSHYPFGDYEYSKGQIQALSADGSFEDTPDVPAAELIAPGYDYSDIRVPSGLRCPKEVEVEYPLAP